MGTHSEETERDIQRAAAAWFARLQSGDASAADQVAFADWLAAEDRNLDAFAEIERRWTEAELLRAAVPSAPSESRLAAVLARSARLRWTPRMVQIAWTVPMLMAVVIGLLLYHPPAIHMAGDTPSMVTLPDGTRMHLQRGAKARVTFKRDVRVVDVLQGRVEFQVHADADRAFVVMAANGRMESVGSQFAVAVAKRGAEVQVEGGLLKLSVAEPLIAGTTIREIVLGAGESASYLASRHSNAPRADDISALRWVRKNVSSPPGL